MYSSLIQVLQTELKEYQQQLANQNHAKDEAEMRLNTLLKETAAIKQQLDRSNAEMCVIISDCFLCYMQLACQLHHVIQGQT